MTLPRIGQRVESEPSGLAIGLFPPAANFSWSGTGLTRQFTDLSTDVDGFIVDWQWNFGDAPAAPIADFSFAVNGLVVQFNDESTDTPPGIVTGWSWNFGDGGTSTQRNPSHTYAAAGAYVVTLTVTDNDGLSSVVPAQQTVSLGGLGVPFGPMNGWESTSSPKPNTSVFTYITGADSPSSLVPRINAAGTLGKKMMVVMTGGKHSQYTRDGLFDRGPNWPNTVAGSLWADKVDTFYDGPNGTRYRALEAGVAGGTILGAQVMDEPPHSTWGPGGTGAGENGYITKQLVDKLAEYMHQKWPFLPAGAYVRHDWQPSRRYATLDYVINAYDGPSRESPVAQFISETQAQGALDNVVVVYSMNILGGGYRCPGCPLVEVAGCGPTGGFYGGQSDPNNVNCRMTGPNVSSWGTSLLNAGTPGLIMWQYDPEFMSPDLKPENITAFNTLKALAQTKTMRRWSNRI
jgi:hypothetical protein